MNNALTVLPLAEIELLDSYEAQIAKGLSSFIEVGEALSAIRDARLYRATHATFEDYCREKWRMSKRHCDRLISSAEVAQSLGPIGPKIENEGQARELARVEPEHRAAVVERAIQATGGKITAAALKEATVYPLPPIKPAALAAGDAAECESDTLWLLKNTWRKTTKKDRSAFINWAQNK